MTREKAASESKGILLSAKSQKPNLQSTLEPKQIEDIMPYKISYVAISYLMSSGVLGSTARKAHSKYDAAFRSVSIAFLLLSDKHNYLS